MVTADSEIESVEDLQGKKVAATKGTDPYFFLLQSLHERSSLEQSDVEVVILQHADGKTALERGDVDAWSGSIRSWRRPRSKPGSRLIYRNIDFNTWGALNSKAAFLDAYPGPRHARARPSTRRSRHWILENPGRDGENPERGCQPLGRDGREGT